MKKSLHDWWYGREIGDDGHGNTLRAAPGYGAETTRTVLTFCAKNWNTLLIAAIGISFGTLNQIHHR